MCSILIYACVLYSWPFLTTSAFVTPEQETVVIIMNEANLDTHIILQDDKRTIADGVGKGDLWFGIPARAIQTIVYK